MRVALKLHPDCRCDAVRSIEVDVTRARDGIDLRYRAVGTIANLLIPKPIGFQRANELWRHTCFEAFIRVPGSTAYREFNFAPSGGWAAYAFDSYRCGVRNVDVWHLSLIADPAGDDAYELAITLGPETDLNRPWQLGLSAVIEETSGRKSYWALAHPQGKPDFHHPDGFQLTLG